MLWVVPTPIGNLGDITLRAIEVLKEADLILAEDTRTSKKLLNHFDINGPCQSYHAHNEHKVVQDLIKRLSGGENIALISDAGMPGISDPGYLLIREAIKAEIPFEVLPGPTAFVLALLYSGFPSHDFRFMGFLPQKKGRLTAIKEISDYPGTLIIYESPYRIIKLLNKLHEMTPERLISISREMTKIHEETLRGTAGELQDVLSNRPAVKGEFVVVLAPRDYQLEV